VSVLVGFLHGCLGVMLLTGNCFVVGVLHQSRDCLWHYL